MSRFFSFLLPDSDGQENVFLLITKGICFILWDKARYSSFKVSLN